MKTYLFDTLNRFRRFSENLDVKATLCNRPWQVFNDSGEKELYIFQEDGTLLITYSGRVTHSTWQYIAANKSIVISAGEQSYMVHPAFMDNVLFALQVDGTNECAFLIDENNAQSFAPRSYTALMGYFEEKERRALEEERRKRQAAIDAENRRRQAAIEEQRKRELEEEQRRMEEEEMRRNLHIQKIYREIVYINIGEGWLILFSMLSFLISDIIAIFVFDSDFFGVLLGIAVSAFLIIGFVSFCKLGEQWIPMKRLKRYIERNSDAWEIPYLVKLHNDSVKKERYKVYLGELPNQ